MLSSKARQRLASRIILICIVVLMMSLFGTVRAEEALLDNGNGTSPAITSSQEISSADTAAITGVDCSYRTHVENIGWQDYVKNGAISGTEGRSLRLEGIEIKLNNVTGDLGIEYATHVENDGWQDYVKNGAMSGTEGRGLRLEAIKIRLIGAAADQYDVYYQVHAQNFGWLDWAKNGKSAGTESFGFRLEAIRIVVVTKDAPAPGETERPFVTGKIQNVYQTHIQNIGWQDWKESGELSGTTAQGLRLEAIKIKNENTESNVGIEYQTHVQNIGWQGWRYDGEMSGTANQGLRLEGIQIRLTGPNAEFFDVYYEPYVEGFGWLTWSKNGENAGTEGLSLRLEGIKILVLPKTSPPPGTTENEKGSIVQLVNKNHSISPDYVPNDLVFVNLPSTQNTELRAVAAQGLSQLFNAANQQGLILYCCSGYRSYATQAAIYQSNVDAYGVAGADLISAQPGKSEHQLGLAMDVTSASVGFDLLESFGSTAEGQFIRENAHQYGFIVRYPQGKTAITGYAYEPWHLRYVGVDVATAIYNSGKTMEEFYGIY